MGNLFIISRPDRDPRRHTISIVYIADATGTPVGGDDARRAILCNPRHLPDYPVFDHGEILRDYLRYIDSGKRPTPAEMRERSTSVRSATVSNSATDPGSSEKQRENENKETANG